MVVGVFHFSNKTSLVADLKKKKNKNNVMEYSTERQVRLWGHIYRSLK